MVASRRRGRRKLKALPAIPALKRITSLIEEADLTAAIVGATLLEGALERAIANRMTRMTAAEHNTIFHSGLLRNFHPKILMGHALAIYGRETLAELQRVADIRNTFAHSLSNVTFETPKIKEICFKLRRPEMRVPDLFSPRALSTQAIPDSVLQASPKLRYLKTISVLLFLMEGAETKRPARDSVRSWPRFNS